MQQNIGKKMLPASKIPGGYSRPMPYGHPDFNGRRRDYASAILPEEGHYALPLFGSPLRPPNSG